LASEHEVALLLGHSHGLLERGPRPRRVLHDVGQFDERLGLQVEVVGLERQLDSPLGGLTCFVLRTSCGDASGATGGV
jgi:hypothetical protein